MAGKRRRVEEPADDYEEDEFVVNDDGKAKKRSKPDNSKGDDDGDDSNHWELSKNRRIGINEFKGKTLINIREYYDKDGQTLPGKKGISLSMDQFNALVKALPAIDQALRKRGETMPIPKFKAGDDDTGGAEDDGGGDDDGAGKEVSKVKSEKKNYDETSEEEESIEDKIARHPHTRRAVSRQNVDA
ncbi:MAG: hypothetical protein M1820_007078 [Bogoriella megaspora]|nr:MAG: hypothetical protein M1820_007078 [Bogoriella megaspora]